MSMLTPGHPTNPLLSCITMIERGDDVELALLERDTLLASPVDFVVVAWEALGWFEPSAQEFADGLLQQVISAWSKIDPAVGATLWSDMVSVPPRTRFQSQMITRLDPASP